MKMHEIIEAEMNMDVGGMAVVRTILVAEEGRDIVHGTLLIG